VCVNGGIAAVFITPTLVGFGGELNTPAAFPFGKETPIIIE